MQFNIEEYQASKQNVISLIKASHDWENHEGFIADGIINPQIYKDQRFKILIFLGESYGYSHDGMIEIEEQTEEDILGVGHPNRQTSKKVSMLLSLIFQSIKEGRELVDDDFPYLLENKKEHIRELQDALSKAAWVNVKKASKIIKEFGNDATRQDPMEIYKAGVKNKLIIKEQMQTILPDLIIVCSSPVFDCLYDTKILGGGIKKG